MFDHIQLPPEVEAILAELKSRIRRYVLWEGIALAVVVLGLFFWFSLGFDYAVFSVRRLEPPRWLRVGLDVAVLSGVAGVGLVLVLFRVFRSFRAKSLALILEKRFPELGDRLVTAVELCSQPEARSELTSAMLERTVAEATEKLQQLDVGSVFDKQPLRRAVSAATVLLISLIAFATMCPQVFARWRKGYLGLEETYWPREVELVATVLAQPGDRVKAFAEGQYKHPRGSDLVLLFDVPAGKKVPERADLQYRLGGGRGYGRATCFKAGERRFKHAIDDLLDDADFWVTAGDFTNREAYRVRVVDPPRIDVLTAESLFPEHTKRQKLDDESGQPSRETVSVQGTQMSLPVETDFLLRAKSNKPLVRARLQYGPYELSLSPTEASLTTRSADGQTLQFEPISAERAAKFFDAARREFVVPFVLTELATPASRERFEKLGTSVAELARVRADGQSVSNSHSTHPKSGDFGYGAPFAMPPDAALKIFLEDTDDIIGADPARITIHGITDNAPIIAAELEGIGTSVTRKAEIPVAALITDDYGIKDVRFEFQIDDKEPWEVRSLSKSPSGEPREFKLQADDDDPTERFEILKMDLEIGQKLTLTVVAEDADNLNGPHVARSQKFTFKIVSNEELLSLLYQRELNLRKRFEQIISEVKQTRGDLILHRSKADAAKETSGPAGSEVGRPTPSEKAAETMTAVIASVIRSLHAIRKNSTETISVEESFQDIREELINNAVHTPQMLERIDENIVKPLHSLNNGDYPAVDESLGALKLLLDDARDPLPGLDESITQIGVLLDQMDSILKEMRRLETFQEAIELLKSIIDQQQQLEDRTKSERKKRRIQELKGLSDEEGK